MEHSETSTGIGMVASPFPTQAVRTIFEFFFSDSAIALADRLVDEKGVNVICQSIHYKSGRLRGFQHLN